MTKKYRPEISERSPADSRVHSNFGPTFGEARLGRRTCLVELPKFSRYNGLKAVYPIAAADPRSLQGHCRISPYLW